MKKFISLALVIVLAVSLVCVVFGCTSKKSDEEEIPNITSIEAKIATGTTFTVGTKFDTTKITVTAICDDKTERKVTTTDAIAYDYAVLKLDKNGKFTEAGEYKLKVTYSEWSTEVTVKVTAA